MASPIDDQQICSRRNQVARDLKLLYGYKGIIAAVYNHGANTQLCQMLRSHLIRTSGSMQRTRKQQHGGAKVRFLGKNHAGLPPAITLTAEKDALTGHL